MLLPDPNLYPTWQQWAQALNALVGDTLGDTGASAGEVMPATSLLPIVDADGRPLVTSAGLWIYRDGGRPPIAPNNFIIDTADIATAAIVTSKLGPQVVTNAKLADLAVEARALANQAVDASKLADAAVTATKIALLAVGAAAIQDLAVGTDKIADAAIVTAKVGDLQVTTAKINDAAVNQAKIANLAVGSAQINDLAVTNAKIDNLAVTSGKIDNLAVTNAKIDNLAVDSAKIANLAVTTGKIDDLAVTSAKITSLIIDKIASGQLNAVIDVAGGRFQFTVGASTLVIGNGFGSSNQFFLWYGLTVAITSMNESNAIVFLKTNGSAYFGGTLAAGILKNAAQTTDTTSSAAIVVGPFTTIGHTKTITLSYEYNRRLTANAGTGAASGAPTATILVEKNTGGSWSTLTTYNGTGTVSLQVDGDPSVRDVLHEDISGSVTLTDNTASGTMTLRATLTSRSFGSLTGSGLSAAVITQSIGLISTES